MTRRIARRRVLAAAGALAAAPAWASAGGAVAVELLTELGAVRLRLAASAPLTTANFLRYVDARRLDGASFYRAARAPGAPGVGLVEGGLQNDPARLFPPVAHESTAATGLTHGDGTISMARDAPGSATADFFICCGPAPYLDAHPGAPGDNAGYGLRAGVRGHGCGPRHPGRPDRSARPQPGDAGADAGQPRPHPPGVEAGGVTPAAVGGPPPPE